MRLLRVISFFTILLLVAASCSREKDLFSSKLYHRMVSKYNILFNGEQALLKARTTLKTQHKDDFDKLLPIYIEGDEKSVSGIKPDLEKAIEKGTKTIKRHSMMIENEQKNNYIDDAYLLIGKARYLNREYMLALETFNYTIQEFKDPQIRAEAQLWAAKTETALENTLAAKARFEKLYSDKELSEYLDADVYGAFAALEIQQDRYLNAYQLLIQGAEKTSEKEQEVRWLYICGQLQASLGNDYEASQLFLKVIKKGPPYELLFNAQLNRARNYDVDLMDPDEAYEELEKMLRDEKNYDNRDRIYYVMAEVAEKLDEPEDRDHFLNRSLRVNTNNQKQKGLSYLWLGEIRFDEKRYEAAQAYYDSCYQFLPEDHPRYNMVKVLKESLGRLVDNLNTIALQDSLQALAALSPKQQMAAAEKIIERLKAEEEAKRQAENEALNQLAFQSGNQQDGGLAGLAGVGSANQQFYFYNPSLRSSGVSTFTQRWGNRKLEDNWRRSDKTVEAQGVAQNQGESGEKSEGEEKLDPKYDPETYLADIPSDSAELEASHRLIQNALLDNALLYKEEIRDLMAAAKSVQELLERYPNFQGMPRAWYILYRVYVLMPDEALATKYKNLILSQYPESEYAYLILNEGKEKKNVDESEAKRAYAEAYLKYDQKSYRSALSATEQAIEKYADSHFGAKLLLLKAYCQGALQRKEDLIKTLKGVLEAYPMTDESAKAKEILAAIDTEVPEEKGGQKSAKQVNYRSDFSSMHRYVLVVPNGKVNANQLTIKLTDFNSKYFPNDKLICKSILMGRDQQIIMVSGLANKNKAQNYRNTLNNEKALEKLLMSIDYKQFVISNANFTDFYKNQDVEGYQKFYNENYLK